MVRTNRSSRTTKEDISFTFEFEGKNFVVNDPNCKGVLMQDMRAWEDTIIYLSDGRIIHLHAWEYMVPYMRPVVDKLEQYVLTMQVSELAAEVNGFIATLVE